MRRSPSPPDGIAYVLKELDPPVPPQPDLTPSALALPLGAVSGAHIGRKLRLVVQILAVDPSGAHALVSAPSEHAGTPRPTLMIALSAALLGHSPAASAVRAPERWATSEHRPDPAAARQKLYLAFGEWINVVGWLEAAEALPKVAIPHGCAPPPLALLEAIHISPARAPPQDAVFRGQLNCCGQLN